MIRYTQFIQVLQRTQLDVLKIQARKAFNRYDERRLSATGNLGTAKIKPGLLSKVEVIRAIEEIVEVDNIRGYDSWFEEADRDRDGYLNLEEVIAMINSVACNYL